MKTKTMIKIFLLIVTVLLTGWELTPKTKAQTQVGCGQDGVGTSDQLRTAINFVNQSVNISELQLTPGCVYVLDDSFTDVAQDGATHLPYIQADLTIIGNGATLRRPEAAPDYRMLVVPGGVTLTIEDLTFENGHAFAGGAVYVKGNAKLIVENVSFIGNSATHSGGAIAAAPGEVTIRGSHFENNEAESLNVSSSGGAVSVVGITDIADTSFVNNQASSTGGVLTLTGAVTLEHNEFTGNKALGGPGGAVRIGLVNTDAFIIRNKFFNNEAVQSGGGLYVFDPRLSPLPTLGHFTIHNNLWVNQRTSSGTHLFLHVIGNGAKSFTVHHNTFVGDQEQTAAGVYLNQAVHPQGALLPTKIFNNIIVGHQVGLQNAGPFVLAGKRNLFFDVQVPVVGNFPQVAPIFADPQFVDPLNGDYHLKEGSDAIDTGTDTLPIILDLDGTVRPKQEGPDIGAYEFFIKNPQNDDPTPTPSPTSTPSPTPSPTPETDFTVYLPLVVK